MQKLLDRQDPDTPEGPWMAPVGEAPGVGAECEMRPWKGLEARACRKTVQALFRALGFSLSVRGSYLKILVKEKEII